MLTYFDLLNLYNHQKFLQSLLNYYIDINSPIFAICQHKKGFEFFFFLFIVHVLYPHYYLYAKIINV